MFQKVRKTTTQHHSKYKTRAALGGLLLWLGLGPHLEELSRRGLEIFGALAKGNRLKRLDEKNWPSTMGNGASPVDPIVFWGWRIWQTSAHFISSPRPMPRKKKCPRMSNGKCSPRGREEKRKRKKKEDGCSSYHPWKLSPLSTKELKRRRISHRTRPKDILLPFL